MNISRNACNAAVLGDCNRFPFIIMTAKRALTYWFKILSMSPDRYVKKCSLMMMNVDSLGRRNWVTELKELLFINGYGYVWKNQGTRDINAFILNLKDA